MKGIFIQVLEIVEIEYSEQNSKKLRRDGAVSYTHLDVYKRQAIRGTVMENLKLKDFLDYKFISNLEISPNGAKTGFIVHKADYDNNNYQSNIWLLDNTTKEYSKLTGLNEERSFLWLNDSTILFPATRDKKINEKVSQGETWTDRKSVV